MTDQIVLNLYCDEIKEVEIHDSTFGNEKWAYIGILIVPANKQQELLSYLLNRRCGNPAEPIEWGRCEPPCKHHIKNDKEVHYESTTSMDVYFIADRWLDFLLEDKHLTYFYILGIDLNTLDHSCFGDEPKNRHQRIYNRFFRTAILKSVKSYFYQYNKIIINSIIHDDSELRYHDYFPWNIIYRIDRYEEKVITHCSKIDFLDSDHHKSNDERSHLIQYVDIILGSVFNALHWQSKDQNKTKVAQKIYPLLKRLIRAPSNVRSRYKYVGRESVDFFPSRRFGSLTEWDADINHNRSFYKKREIRIGRSFQPTLFEKIK